MSSESIELIPGLKIPEDDVAVGAAGDEKVTVRGGVDGAYDRLDEIGMPPSICLLRSSRGDVPAVDVLVPTSCEDCGRAGVQCQAG